MFEIEISKYSGRLFLISTPERFTDTNCPIPARNFCVDCPPGCSDLKLLIPSRSGFGDDRSGFGDDWNGWFPSCKPGLEGPWDGTIWGQPPTVYPRDKDGNINFYPYAPVQFGKAFPLGNNELFPIIKKVRALLGRDFYKFNIYFDAKKTGDVITASEHEDYRLTGSFPGFDFSRVVDLPNATAA